MWASVSSKEKDSSAVLTVKLGTSSECQPSASNTSDTRPLSMLASHSVPMAPTVGSRAPLRHAAPHGPLCARVPLFLADADHRVGDYLFFFAFFFFPASFASSASFFKMAAFRAADT